MLLLPPPSARPMQALLARGYTVHGTSRSLGGGCDHLRSLPGAGERLRLFAADLMAEGSFDAAIAGCVGVFHAASPFFSKGVTAENAAEKLLDPAVQGTLNVLRACTRAGGVRRVVLTSSMAAVWQGHGADGARVFSDADWTDEGVMRGRGAWYVVSKVMAERAAWEYLGAHADGFGLVTVCPSLVLGPMLQVRAARRRVD